MRRGSGRHAFEEASDFRVHDERALLEDVAGFCATFLATQRLGLLSMHFDRPRSLPKEQWLRTRAERGVRNRRQKRALVEQSCTHGIPVYAMGEPVGWCQYGPREELPRIDNKRIYEGLAPDSTKKLSRITCFAVLKPYRKRGVASAALQAALESIRRQGGGLVEAYPITRFSSHALVRRTV